MLRLTVIWWREIGWKRLIIAGKCQKRRGISFWWSRLDVTVLSMGPSPQTIEGSSQPAPATHNIQAIKWSQAVLLPLSAAVRATIWVIGGPSADWSRSVSTLALRPPSPSFFAFLCIPHHSFVWWLGFPLELGKDPLHSGQNRECVFVVLKWGHCWSWAVGIYRHCNCKSVQKLGHLH